MEGGEGGGVLALAISLICRPIMLDPFLLLHFDMHIALGGAKFDPSSLGEYSEFCLLCPSI